MSDLVKALQILLTYKDPKQPIHCEKDKLFINVNPDIVSEDDKEELERLGFYAQDDYFYSVRFGSFW